MASSDRTGLVLKISIVLFVLIGLLVYKLNDNYRNEKLYSSQKQIRDRVVSLNTSVSSQLSQIRKVLSSYEREISEANLNWVQLDPFFAIARVENLGSSFKVLQLSVRSGTPAERWNAEYLSRAMMINKSLTANDVNVQIFKDKARNSFIILRFALGNNQELVTATTSDYFQKYFDIERGSNSKSLLITEESILVAHTEADYVGSPSKESRLSSKKYLSEKEEIIGTNLRAVSYVLKSKVVSGFAVPWSIVGVIVGFGFVLIAILYYGLDPIERRIERYKKQERAQIYKDTVKEALQGTAISGLADPDTVSVKGSSSNSTDNLGNKNNSVQEPSNPFTDQSKNLRDRIEEAKQQSQIGDQSSIKPPAINQVEQTDEFQVTVTRTLTAATPLKEEEHSSPLELRLLDPVQEIAKSKAHFSENELKIPIDVLKIDSNIENLNSPTGTKKPDIYDLLEPARGRPSSSSEANVKPSEVNVKPQSESPQPPPITAEDMVIETLDEEKMDLEMIERALTLDLEGEKEPEPYQQQVIEKSFQPQKISLEPSASTLEKPTFSMSKKEFNVDTIKVNIRRPERS